MDFKELDRSWRYRGRRSKALWFILGVAVANLFSLFMVGVLCG